MVSIRYKSSSKHVRDGVVKGRFDNYDIGGIVKKVRDMGFYVGANYIFGLPKLIVAAETLDLSLRVNSEWANFYSAMAYLARNFTQWPNKKMGHQMIKKAGWMDIPNMLMKLYLCQQNT